MLSGRAALIRGGVRAGAASRRADAAAAMLRGEVGARELAGGLPLPVAESGRER
ncbi:hypothetical protein ACFXG4_13860 [Nocardia sp. NPDC059246]|uniref:hypothetical protein n=1 Tax=Nocardia sp. NPDC059246 TaxID=3346789 RepID=UPI0036CE6312